MIDPLARWVALGGLALLVFMSWANANAIGRISARLEEMHNLMREALFPITRKNYGDSHLTGILEELGRIQSDTHDLNARQQKEDDYDPHAP